MFAGIFVIVGIGFSISLSVLHASNNVESTSPQTQDQFTEIERIFTSLLLKHGDKMELKYNALLKEHEQMKSDFKSLEKECETLKKQVKIMRKRDESIEKQFFELRDIVKRSAFTNWRKNSTSTSKTDFSDRISVRKMDILHGNGNAMSQNADLYEELMQNIPNERRFLPGTSPTSATPTNEVAFFTRLSQNMINPGYNQHIQFDEIVTNIGGGYMGPLATFVCPKAGTYVFFVTIVTFPGKYLTAEIVAEGDELAHIFSNSGEQQSSSSNMAVATIQQHAAVWVRVNAGQYDTGTVAMETWSTFSGFLVQ